MAQCGRTRCTSMSERGTCSTLSTGIDRAWTTSCSGLVAGQGCPPHIVGLFIELGVCSSLTSQPEWAFRTRSTGSPGGRSSPSSTKHATWDVVAFAAIVFEYFSTR
ncbi:hypothetical protein A0H81_01713 [Grifola frondosa]|uniref:Uncharacterized protein n=1 Tax=Grifola frondosa TaxID=5627 RepID=A0A1C7MND5_GRIFR|nr:hypothetical protein A0H81_01713 [Grifola frondosa]